VGAEAASLAGHLRLGRLNVLYDNNHVTLSGTTSITFTEDVGARFAAYGWHVDASPTATTWRRSTARCARDRETERRR
jgi:transketolase